MIDAPFVRSVLHPSDFSQASHAAFAHALAIVLYRQASFDVLHVVLREQDVHDWSDGPSIRGTLERWGLLQPGSPRSALGEKLSLQVAKINVHSKDPLEAILRVLEDEPADLLVLSTEGREGLPRWLRPSLAESVARESKTMTLFVPEGSRGFVSHEEGRISLRRVLVPVDARPDPTPALTHAVRAAVMSHESAVEIVLLHVGEETSPPWPDFPELESCTWRKIQRGGDVVGQIIQVAEETDPGLIVMATEGRKGILGSLRGSVTEQVLRRSPCPLLAVPAERG